MVKDELWATPRSGKTSDEDPAAWQKRKDAGDVSTMPLTLQVKGSRIEDQVAESWSSPQSRDFRSGHPDRREDPGRSKNLNDQQGVVNAKLNPRWVETLMGLPIGWTRPGCNDPRHPLDPTRDRSEDVTVDNRTDELRMLGNGVVPAAAELAFRTLLGRFGCRPG
jgi:hypothetical protein